MSSLARSLRRSAARSDRQRYLNTKPTRPPIASILFENTIGGGGYFVCHEKHLGYWMETWLATGEDADDHDDAMLSIFFVDLTPNPLERYPALDWESVARAGKTTAENLLVRSIELRPDRRAIMRAHIIALAVESGIPDTTFDPSPLSMHLGALRQRWQTAMNSLPAAAKWEEILRSFELPTG